MPTTTTTTMAQEEDRTPQIRYGEAAGDKPSSFDLSLSIANACWKTNEEVEFDESGGQVYITQDHLLFHCSTNQDHSVSIDAECILLHAQSEDDVVYLQLQDPKDGEDEVMELTLKLESNADCNQLFAALSQLVSLHPVDQDDDDGMMMGGENYGEDMVVASNDVLPTEGERNAMLDRLDALLVVPSNLQKGDDNVDGQFDDADDALL